MKQKHVNIIDTQFCQSILANQTLGILLFEENLSLCYLNTAAEELLRVSHNSVVGKPIKEVLRGSKFLNETIMHEALQTKESRTGKDIVLFRSEVGHIDVGYKVFSLITENEPIKLIVELQDIGSQKRVEMDQAMLEQTETSSLLLRNLAHEIKNPLGGVRGAAQLLALENPEFEEYTSIIISEADRLKQLVDNMLGPNHLPEYKQINIHQVLERVRSLVLVENTQQLTIMRNYDPSIPELNGDFNQLLQVVLNITRNAVSAMKGEGLITFRTRILRSCLIGDKKHRHAIQLTIMDNGPGIASKIKDKIFFPLVSASEKGMGLGLSIAQRLVNQHGGVIESDSRVGDTRFTILLPLEL